MKIKTKQELEFFLKADYMMNRGKFKPSVMDKIQDLFLPDYIMRYLKQMRMASYYSMGRGILCKLKYLWHYRKFRKLGIKLGFSIGHDCLGYGVVIPHYGTIIVGGSARIGNYAVLHTSTCVTNNKKIIGDGLYLSTGVKITSEIILGSNISIGANSLVNKSYEGNNILMGGVPAKCIKEAEPWYIRDHFGRKVQQIEELRKRYNLYGI